MELGQNKDRMVNKWDPQMALIHYENIPTKMACPFTRFIAKKHIKCLARFMARPINGQTEINSAIFFSFVRPFFIPVDEI